MARKKGAAAAGAGGAGTPAMVALNRAGIPYRVVTFEHDPSVTNFGAEAAAALDFPAEGILKTLLVDTERGLAVGIVPVTGNLGLKDIATALGVKKARIADPAVAERTTGYIVGGISPIGQKKALPTVIDSSVEGLPEVLVSGGRRGTDIALAPADLARATSGTFARIAR